MRLSVYMKFSASYTENRDNSTEQGRVTLVSDKLPTSLWLESCPKSLCWPGSRDLRLCKELYSVLVDLPILFIATTLAIQQLSFSSGRERRGEKKKPCILSISLLNCQILFIKVRKKMLCKYKHFWHFGFAVYYTASPIHEQIPLFERFPNVRHEQASPGIQSNQKIKAGFWFPHYKPEIQ